MSIDPAPNAPTYTNRQAIIICLGILVILCVGCIVASKLPPIEGEFGSLVPVMAGFFVLDILALIGLGMWLLRAPAPGAVNFLGRWAGKILLFLGFGLAAVIFLFATCLGVLAL